MVRTSEKTMQKTEKSWFNPPPSRQAPMPRAKGPNVRSRERARTGPSGNGDENNVLVRDF